MTDTKEQVPSKIANLLVILLIIGPMIFIGIVGYIWLVINILTSLLAG